MRATSQDPDTARLMGVDPDRVIVLTFVLGAALAGVAGVLYGADLGFINIDIGFQNGIFAFTAAVLGGIGSIRAPSSAASSSGWSRPSAGSTCRAAPQYDYVWIFVVLIAGAGVPAAGLLRRDGEGARMTPRPARRPHRCLRSPRRQAAQAALARASGRAAGGAAVVVGALLPWATFVLNDGAYPDKATLQFFDAPFARHRVPAGTCCCSASLALRADVRADARPAARILRALGWGVVAIVGGQRALHHRSRAAASARSPSPTARWRSAVVVGARSAGVLVIVGARPAASSRPAGVDARLSAPVGRPGAAGGRSSRLLSAGLGDADRGGQGGAANPYAGAVFLSFLGFAGRPARPRCTASA